MLLQKSDRIKNPANQIAKSPFQPTLVARMMAPSSIAGKLLQLVSFCVFVYALVFVQADKSWWLVAVFVYFLTSCIGQSVTFHRALAHRSITLKRPIEVIFTLLGTVGGTLSSIAFVAMHRAHHAHSDTDRDPHTLQTRGWLILFSAYDFDGDPRFVKDLLRDPFHRYLHKHYTVILLFWASFLLLINPLLCAFCFFIPIFWQITISNLGNILTHSYGYRNYELPDQSVNNILVTLLTWGEGWHNNHHASPSYWHLGRRWWEFDPGAMVIIMLRRLRLLSLGKGQAIPLKVIGKSKPVAYAAANPIQVN